MEENKLKNILRSYGHRYYRTVGNHKDDGMMEYWFDKWDEETIAQIKAAFKEDKERTWDKAITVVVQTKKKTYWYANNSTERTVCDCIIKALTIERNKQNVT